MRFMLALCKACPNFQQLLQKHKFVGVLWIRVLKHRKAHIKLNEQTEQLQQKGNDTRKTENVKLIRQPCHSSVTQLVII